VSTALSVKPLLHVLDGEIVLADKVRTTSKARARLVDLGVEGVTGPVDVAIHHLAAPEQAVQVAESVRERLDDVRSLVITELGAVIGAHVGPGSLGVVVAPALLHPSS